MVISLHFASPGYAKIDPETIIAVWLFDEEGGNLIKDSEGKGIDGVTQGSVEWVNSPSGKALKFNGKDTYVAIPDTPY